ncbi:hypothetical protein VCHA53O466_40038 [Vibrio chagasii]|nr:hypothetical protein VCHA53O466_40038 [Vibrio chagasii]
MRKQIKGYTVPLVYTLMPVSVLLFLLQMLLFARYDSYDKPDYMLARSVWSKYQHTGDVSSNAIKLYRQNCPHSSLEVHDECIEPVIDVISLKLNGDEINAVRDTFTQIAAELYKVLVEDKEHEAYLQNLVDTHNQTDKIYLKYPLPKVEAMSTIWKEAALKGDWQDYVISTFTQRCTNSMSFVNANCVDKLIEHMKTTNYAEYRDEARLLLMNVRGQLEEITAPEISKTSTSPIPR